MLDSRLGPKYVHGCSESHNPRAAESGKPLTSNTYKNNVLLFLAFIFLNIAPWHGATASPSEQESIESSSQKHKTQTTKVSQKAQANSKQSVLDALIWSKKDTEFINEIHHRRYILDRIAKDPSMNINANNPLYATYVQKLISSIGKQWQNDYEKHRKINVAGKQATIHIIVSSQGRLSDLTVLYQSPIPSINISITKAVKAAAPFEPLPVSWGMTQAGFVLTFSANE